jgi:hypothetical protein
LEIGFVEHFNTRLATTLNYGAIADVHTLQIATSHAKSFQSAVLTSPSLVTSSNNGDSSASALSSLPDGSQLLRLSLIFTDSLTNDVTSKLVSVITSRHGPRRKHRFQQFLYSCAQTRCPGNLFVSRSLPTIGSTSYNIKIFSP